MLPSLQLEPGPQPQSQAVGRPHGDDATREVNACERRDGPHGGDEVTLDERPRIEPHVLRHPDAREIRLHRAIDSRHHPAAPGDDEGVRALADDGDGSLRRDHDPQRVWVRAIEADGGDRRQRSDVDPGRVEIEPEEARPRAVAQSPFDLTLDTRAGAAHVDRADGEQRASRARARRPGAPPRTPRSRRATSGRRGRRAQARGDRRLLHAGTGRRRSPAACETAPCALVVPYRPPHPVLRRTTISSAAPVSRQAAPDPTARPRAGARRRTARAPAGAPPLSARGSRRSSPRRRSR